MDVIRGDQKNVSDPAYGYKGTEASATYNDTLDTVTQFSEWLPIVGVLAVAGIIIYLVVRSFPQGR